jgi:hypothetical protein
VARGRNDREGGITKESRVQRGERGKKRENREQNQFQGWMKMLS